MDSEFTAAEAAYNGVGAKKTNVLMRAYLSSAQNVTPETFKAIVAWSNGLSPLTVTADKEAILRVADCMQRLGLRTVAYLEPFMEFMPHLDRVMLVPAWGQ